MYIVRAFLIVGILALTAASCSDDDSPQQPVGALTTVDDFLARVCKIGGDCGGSTSADILQCPAELLSELDAEDLAELEAFLALEKAEQDRVLECFAEEVCGRFGGSVLNMSDSDLMEPLRSCD